MAEQPELEPWVSELLEAFEIPDAPIDIDAVLSLAGVAAHQIVRPAAPLTTYIAGFAAGLAAGSGQAPEAEAVRAADRVAREALSRRAEAAGSTD